MRILTSFAKGKTLAIDKGLMALLLSFAICSFSTNLSARIFFEDSFDSGDISSGPSPIWAWKPPLSPSNITTGMMYGEGDVYEVVQDIAHSGGYSLRLNFSGRNGFCNICGAKSVEVTAEYINSRCFSITGAPWESYVFNQTNGFSKWSVASSSSTQVCLNGTPLNQSLFRSVGTAIAPGDTLLVPYKCGVNGNVGDDVSRKSDCNRAINYFDNVSTNDVPLGGTVARRFYMYIPSTTVLPEVTLKLAYSHWNTGSGVRSVKLKVSVQRGLTMELNMPNSKNYVGQPALERNKWYYFEEVFKRETADGAGNARYQLYVGESGKAPELVVDEGGFNLGRLVDMSMHGNWQHWKDVSGYIYFDDIVIADAFIGPIASDGTTSSPPSILPPLTITR